MRVVFAVIAMALAALVMFAAPPALSEPARFASAIDDLPLMDGLEERAATPFETAQGRIVRIEAAGAVTTDDVERFYLETLPALGWRRASNDAALVFARAGERLELRVENDAHGGTQVTFLITPAGSAAY